MKADNLDRSRTSSPVVPYGTVYKTVNPSPHTRNTCFRAVDLELIVDRSGHSNLNQALVMINPESFKVKVWEECQS